MFTYLLALLAGSLSTINPCVLPILPIVIGSALSKSRFGPLALAAGLTLSFTGFGLFVLYLGSAIGVGANTFRSLGAVLLIAFGAILLSETLQKFFGKLSAPFASSTDKLLNKNFFNSLFGLFLSGLLLGAVWSPCTGPTLGAAIGLVAQQEAVLHGIVTMFLFGIGASLPLILIGYGGRGLVMKRRENLMQLASYGKKILGIIFLLLGVLVISGWDKLLESKLLDLAPDWLVLFTVSI